ncbi:MAG: hypothetical protein GX868_09835, partial [Actinobacteria bacterium]|nr:hypothetical protein [Actinomycetota bacterium]
HPHLGTVLVVEDPLWRELWTDVLDVVTTAPVGRDASPSSDANVNADTNAAADKIEGASGPTLVDSIHTQLVVLDLVCHLATDRSAFLLDERFAALLTGEEKAIADQLRSVARLLKDLDDASSIKVGLDAALRSLGHQ